MKPASKIGFTLMEILVALAVLAASSAVFGRVVDSFISLRRQEKLQAAAFICSVQTMERLIANVPVQQECSTVVKIERVPGVVPLCNVEVQTRAMRPVTFRRLLSCEALP